MKAAIIRAPDALPKYGDFPEPIVSKGDELVELVAAGIHQLVRGVASGRHYGSTQQWPIIPGVDAVARRPDGRLIYTAYVRPPYGTLAERMAAPATVRIPLPPGADPVQVAGGLNPGLASWLPLTARAKEVNALGCVLIIGVTGVAGSLAVQNARVLGATRVIGAGRDLTALGKAADSGVETVALTGDRDTDAAAFSDALKGTAPSIVLDFLWSSAAEAALHALGRRGLDEDSADIAYVEIGAAAGPNAMVPGSLLRSRRIRIYGYGLGSARIADVNAQIPIYVQLIADREIEVPTQVFPLSSIADAWAASTNSRLRVVVVP